MNPAEAGLSFTRYSEDTRRLEIYPSSGGDYWKCLKCKDRGDKWYMLDHVCSSSGSIVVDDDIIDDDDQAFLSQSIFKEVLH
jgi:hypothetical protein